jgi:two-component system chemotaxis response regulator CheY
VDAKPCILLVDDEADFRFSASVALRKAGCEVVEAADGMEAISRFQEFRRAGKRFDLLLTDLRMPGLCGLELLETLEDMRIYVPVVAVTGYCDDALREDLKRKGCTEFMEKPFEPVDLVKRVEKMLENVAPGEEGR